MADNSKIEWTDATWNPITGCTIVSPGCTNCYAMKLAGTRMKNHRSRKGLTQPSKAGPVWNGEVRFNQQWLEQPLHWRKPRKIFVCAHGDLFHKDVPDEWINKIFAVMALAPQHTFQVLTKRAERMREYFSSLDDDKSQISDEVYSLRKYSQDGVMIVRAGRGDLYGEWPLANVHLGVSVEDQTRADERIPPLLDTPAAVRFISAEPLLGPIDLRSVRLGHMPSTARLDQVIVGGESGPGARPMHPDWARSLRDQCEATGVAFHFKQWGEWVGGRCQKNGWFWFHNNSGGPGCDHHWGDGCGSDRVGKKSAGRLLDGREWNGVVSRLPEDEAKTKWCP